MNRTRLARLQRRKLVAERYLRLETQWEIANALGISQATVSKDLAALIIEWTDGKDTAIADVIARELAKIDLLERYYWNAYDKSCRPKKGTRGKTVDVGDKERARTEVGRWEEERDGNPTYLQGVERCIRLRAEILGYLMGRDASDDDGKTAPSANVRVVEEAPWYGQLRNGKSAPGDGASTPDPARPSTV